MPANPAGWLVTTAWRAALDQLRRAAVGRQKLALLANEPQPEFSDPADDDTLALIFGCCHPTVDPSAQVALTLHAAGGLTTAEIAAAFLNARQVRTWKCSRKLAQGVSSIDGNSRRIGSNGEAAARKARRGP